MNRRSIYHECVSMTTNTPFQLLLLLHLTFRQANLLTILSRERSFTVSRGEALSLKCSFQADTYNLFDYPVLWRKTQQHEEVQVNIMGNVNEPFMNKNRFEVSFVSEQPRYHLELTITDVSVEDSANYTCEVRGPHSVVLGQVTYFVYVKAPVESVVISDAFYSETQLMTSSLTSSLTSLSMREGQATSVYCTARGGYPPPVLEVYVGSRDVTSAFLLTQSVDLSGPLGLRVMTYRTERSTNHFIPGAEDDGQRLRCIAAVPGLKASSAYLLLAVDYSPKVNCFSTGAYPGEMGVQVSCHVRCKPMYSSLFWIIDSNGTTVSEGDVIDGHWTTVEEDRVDGGMVVRLFVHEVKIESFRKYSLVVENSISVASSDSEIFQTEKPMTTTTTTFPPLGGATAVVGQSKTRIVSRDPMRHRSKQQLKSALSDQKRRRSFAYLLTFLLTVFPRA